MKKSLLSLALAGSMLSALAVPAFAATPSDVVGKPVQSAVEQLTALGIVQGYADGTFKPDNTITRAELAKIVIVATGNESAATLMANTAPSFKDVKKGAWYTGYINAASAKGFIQGYNGNFRPNDTIKFEEVVAILVRALGYQDKHLSGSWPYNVLLQADTVGLFEGIDVKSGTNANRGIVAELTANTLDKQLVSYDADGNLVPLTNGVDTDGNGTIDAYVAKPFISKLGTFDAADVSTSVALNSNGQISLNGTDVPTASSFFVTGGKKLSELLGHTVSVLKNKNGEVIAVTDVTAASKIVSVSTDAATLATAGGATFKVNNGAATYTTAPGLKVYLNTKELPTTQSGTGTSAVYNYTVPNDKTADLILNASGKVQAIVISDSTDNHVLNNVVAYSGYSRIFAKGNTSYNVKVDANTAITLDGKAATLADLKENDVLNVLENADHLALKITATRNTASGKIQGFGTDVDGNATVTIGGKVYSYVGTQDALGAAAVGTDYTLYLNASGKAAWYATTGAVVSGNYAIINSITPDTTIIKDGEVSEHWTKVVYFSLKDNTKQTIYTQHNANLIVGGVEVGEGKLVELTYNTDGTLDLASAGVSVLKAGSSATAVTVKSVSSSALTVNTPGQANPTASYRLDSSTVYLKATVDVNNVDNSSVTTATAADVTENSEVAIQTATNGTAQYVVILSNKAAGLDAVQGLYVSKSSTATSATDITYSVNVNVKGEVKTVSVTKAVYDALTVKNDIVLLKDAATGDSKYDDASIIKTSKSATRPTDDEATAFTVDLSNNFVTATVGGTATKYVVTPATQYFIYKTDGTVEATTYADVLVAWDSYGTDAGKYTVAVQGSINTYNNVNEAGVIYVIAH